jgi:predicted RNA-binding protein YlqC (UPF0109 family)
MKELVELLVKELVDHPEEVEVTSVTAGRNSVSIEVRVSPQDTGKIIGKHGKIANAIRTVVKAAASRMDSRAFVDIVS